MEQEEFLFLIFLCFFNQFSEIHFEIKKIKNGYAINIHQACNN